LARFLEELPEKAYAQAPIYTILLVAAIQTQQAAGLSGRQVKERADR
jgi:hypothetical protein